MPPKSFTFYRTFLPQLYDVTDPVVLSFDTTAFLKPYVDHKIMMPRHFIHSGNFYARPYTQNPELRTKERILSLQERILNEKTEGLMTRNTPVAHNIKTPYWLHPEEERRRALEESFRAAAWAKSVARRPDLLYAGYEIGTFEDATYIFHKSLAADIKRLSAGFGLFSRLPKYRSLDKLHQFEVIAAYNDILDEYGDLEFHASGGSSLNILELLAYANVTSADGSSAVLAGLAYGAVIDNRGKAVRVDKVERWLCTCEFCTSRGKPLDELKTSTEARVRHNINMVRDSERRINEALQNSRIEELTKGRLKIYDQPGLWKCYEFIRNKITRV